MGGEQDIIIAIILSVIGVLAIGFAILCIVVSVKGQNVQSGGDGGSANAAWIMDASDHSGGVDAGHCDTGSHSDSGGCH